MTWHKTLEGEERLRAARMTFRDAAATFHLSFLKWKAYRSICKITGRSRRRPEPTRKEIYLENRSHYLKRLARAGQTTKRPAYGRRELNSEVAALFGHA
jgi:hypothetical protein